MARKQPKITIESFGRYSPWNRNSRELPKILEFTTTIEAVDGNEFGMILHITGGKGIRLNYCIKHPYFRDDSGKVEPDFTGEYFVANNDFKFFIGDCIWLPVEDKTGIWEVLVFYEEKMVASQKFEVVLPV